MEARALCLRYESSAEDVVKQLSFVVPARSSVGVVGRTGAGVIERDEESEGVRELESNFEKKTFVSIQFSRGSKGKSSLALALVRLLEAREGSLLIDGVDIASVGLEELRSRVAMVPQDPVLFNGTVRLDTHTPFVFFNF